MADLSLEDIATQFEEALGESTGTTIAPGTIAPVGTQLSGGRRKLSWPEVVQRIRDDIGVTATETFPSVPAGVPATSFYRAGAETGFLPSGATTFQQSPFGSFQGRMDIAAGQVTEATSEAIESAEEGQKQVISGTRKLSASPEQYTITSNDWTEGPGSMALAGPVNPFSLAGWVGSVLGGTPFHDFGHMLGTQSGGSAHNTEGWYREHDGKTIHMNQTLWRDWDNLRDEQKSLLAAGESKMVQDENGVWRATTGERIEKKDFPNNYTMVIKDPTTRVVGEMEPKEWKSFVKDVWGGKEYTDDEISESWRGVFDTLSGGGYDIGYTLEEEVEANPYDTASVVGITAGGSYGEEGYIEGLGEMQGDVDLSGFTYDEGDTGYEGGFSAWQSGGQIGMQEGGMPMPQPQEGMAPPMQMPQEGVPADMANLGMINEQAAAPPQEGGQESVKDDVPREADEGDYILPYETVLLVGLKQLNRYAREAIKLAMKNDVNLAGTDLDPTDDVPIKVSNYEYHIPKMLVPFFGGGKKYLDKIREEGLSLRKRLEEEKQPSVEQQQPQPTAQPAPSQLEPAPPQMAQAGPPMQPPIMQKGGFVLDPKETAIPTTEAVLEGDASQQTQEASAYNQLQALQRSKKTQQQPPMVDPTGKLTPQGFAAPQGYDAGGTIISAEDALEMQKGGSAVLKNVSPGEKPEISERDYFKLAQQRMQQFHRLEPAKKLAMVAMLEGRGEGRQGMQAIMNVVMNRVGTNSPEFYDNSVQGTPMEQVLMKPLAFTALSALNKDHPYNNPKSKQHNPDKYAKEVDNLATAFGNIRTNDKNWKEAYEDARKALSGKLDDITKGALFYYNPTKQDMPRHLKERAFLTSVGKHHFYKSGGFVDKVLDTAA